MVDISGKILQVQAHILISWLLANNGLILQRCFHRWILWKSIQLYAYIWKGRIKISGFSTFNFTVWHDTFTLENLNSPTINPHRITSLKYLPEIYLVNINYRCKCKKIARVLDLDFLQNVYWKITKFPALNCVESKSWIKTRNSWHSACSSPSAQGQEWLDSFSLELIYLNETNKL